MSEQTALERAQAWVNEGKNIRDALLEEANSLRKRLAEVEHLLESLPYVNVRDGSAATAPVNGERPAVVEKLNIGSDMSDEHAPTLVEVALRSLAAASSASEIINKIRQARPEYELSLVYSALSRMAKPEDGRLIAFGSRGLRRYALPEWQQPEVKNAKAAQKT